jgi:hypothetical protein
MTPFGEARAYDILPQPEAVSMAVTNCAKCRGESVPSGLREKGFEAPAFFVLWYGIKFWWRDLLPLVSDSGFFHEPIAAAPFCWRRGGSFRRSFPEYLRDE